MKRKTIVRLYWFMQLTFCVASGDAIGQQWNPGHKVGTLNGIYSYAYNQTPSQLVELTVAAIPNTGLTYKWFSSFQPTTGFTQIGSSSSYSPPALNTSSQTTYYYRETKITATGATMNSNIVKISVVSVNWEDLNYVREHDVTTIGITTWTAVDQLPIGQKFQTTAYMDGLGRTLQRVGRETSTPANPNDTWGDMVQFSKYDAYGREQTGYLPYTTTSQSGKFKTATASDQSQYYTTTYNETSAFSTISFDNSPLNRPTNVKAPGTSWAASAGNSAIYDINSAAGDDVKIFDVDYVQGDAPTVIGVFADRALYKLVFTDENGKKVVTFSDHLGRVILRKVQLDDNPSATYDGWICTYYVYDDFGLLRYEIEPEGVKYLNQHSWSFTGPDGPTVLAEQVFQYNYDDKGRTIWKKTPGALPLVMIYDSRDRLVFMQDGNQAALSTPQWTADLYDELDRPIIKTLYNTTRTISQLQTDINNSVSVSLVSVTNPNQPVTSLIVNNRQAGVGIYEASNSIEFVSDANGTFESQPGDAFTAQINPSATAPGYTISVASFNNPVSSTDLNNAAVCTVLKYMFYDNYSFSSTRSFSTAYTNLSAYNTSDPNVIPLAISLRTLNMSTGDLTRVFGTNAFLSTTYYYDDQEELLQKIEDNVKSGADITTLQHHFDGRKLSSCSNHSASGGGYTGYLILTKYLFDKLGRITSIQKQFGANAFKTVSSYDYDDVGRVKTKHLDPGYTAGGNSELESLNYTFNIHNQLTGINKDYALKNPSNYNKWGHFFGLYLGFDNRDNVFTSANLNGQIAGVVWNTQGDDVQRRYNYSYDNAGRLTSAAFTEKKHAGDAWSNSQMDFSVNGTSGAITYDLNGNLLNMLQKGVVPGTSTPITVDNLSYTYAAYSNKLQSVTDNMTSTSVNGMFGDFKDGTNGSSPDYVYDANGNLVIDLNKNAKELGGVTGANGIKYNFLDKPEEIHISGKGTIKIVYSADGQKLQRSFTPEPSGATITTTYISQFTYQETAGGSPTLQFINFEEGRIRVLTPTSQVTSLDALVVDGNMDLPNGKRGAYDYYVMDYLGNVRMILTEETHTVSNTATMEADRAALEESIFGQTGASNEVAATRYSPLPAGWTGNTSAKVSRLGTNSGHNIGPNVLQKVMAGDQITASVNYYYSGSSGNNSSILSSVVGALVSSISGSSATSDIVKGSVTNISSQLSGLTDFSTAVQPNGSNPAAGNPQAFLTVLFFDERFNFIAASDGGVAQQQVGSPTGSNGAPLALSAVKVPKNGYVYVYIGNQSANDVYFDDFKVGITAGNIIEENHYYAYGLRIAELSSKKLGDSYEGALKNNHLYQGAFNELDDDIGWNDFVLRNYDPQIGRWVQQDPFQQFSSPYVGMGDDPIGNADPTGGVVPEIVSTLSTTADKAITLGEVIITSSRAVSASAKAANIFKEINIAARFVISAARVATIINGNFSTSGAGGRDPNERLRILTAIAFWEGGAGNDFKNVNSFVELAYIYIHREKKYGLGGGSSFYASAKKNLFPQKERFREAMRILGSPTYAKDKSNNNLRQAQKNLLKEIYKALSNYVNNPKADRSSIPSADNKGFTKQGYEGDLNGNSSDKLEGYIEWNWARWFVYYSTMPGGNTKGVRIFNDENDPPNNGHRHTTFLIDEKALEEFIKKYKLMLEGFDAPKWDPNTNSFIVTPLMQELQFQK